MNSTIDAATARALAEYPIKQLRRWLNAHHRWMNAIDAMQASATGERDANGWAIYALPYPKGRPQSKDSKHRAYGYADQLRRNWLDESIERGSDVAYLDAVLAASIAKMRES